MDYKNIIKMDQLIFKFPFSKRYYEQDFFISSNNFYLLYGENVGLKKDIRDLIINTKNEKVEMIPAQLRSMITDGAIS